MRRSNAIGVWDTVGSVGIRDSTVRLSSILWLLNATSARMSSMPFTRLALDERRKNFFPRCGEQTADGKEKQARSSSRSGSAGVHCDVGVAMSARRLRHSPRLDGSEFRRISTSTSITLKAAPTCRANAHRQGGMESSGPNGKPLEKRENSVHHKSRPRRSRSSRQRDFRRKGGGLARQAALCQQSVKDADYQTFNVDLSPREKRLKWATRT